MVRRIRDTAGTAADLEAAAEPEAEAVQPEEKGWEEALDFATEVFGDPFTSDEDDPEPPAPEPVVSASAPETPESETQGDGWAPDIRGAGPAALYEDPRVAVQRLGRWRRKQARDLARIETELYTSIRRAHEAGVPKLTIAKDAKVSRQTVYNVLAKDGS